MSSAQSLLVAELLTDVAQWLDLEARYSYNGREQAQLDLRQRCLATVVELEREQAEFEAYLAAQWEAQQDAKADATSAGWGHD